MNKSKVVGLTVTVLAVIGGVAVYNWAKTSKKSPEKFLGADGVEPRKGSTISGLQCKDSKGSYYIQTGGQPCRGYDKPIRMIVKGYFGERVS